jgi:uncharacterized membrane protein HdeD (DUF308 family)
VWWLLVLFGVVAIGVGIFLVVSPHETLTTYTVIVGILLLVDGVLGIISSIVGRGEGRRLLALLGVLSAIAGLVLIKKPFDTGLRDSRHADLLGLNECPVRTGCEGRREPF